MVYCDTCGMVPVPEDQLPVRLPLAVLLTAMAVASMTYAIVSEREQTWLYYDGAARAWELLLGGVLACVAP